jgi:betaine lipid synthase
VAPWCCVARILCVVTVVSTSTALCAGGDGRPLKEKAKFVSLDNLRSNIRDDLTVLRHIWFSKARGSDHAARLESFYGPQAEACECARATPS